MRRDDSGEAEAVIHALERSDARIAEPDTKIDALVYELYGLSGEVAVVKAAVVG